MTSTGCVWDDSIILAYTVGTAMNRVIGRWSLQVYISVEMGIEGE